MSSVDDTKGRLLEAAGRVFASRGFALATVREIVKEAGANIAAVHYHFGDKEGLYTAALIAAHRATLKLEPDLEAFAEMPPAEALRRQVGQILRAVLDEQVTDWHRSLLLRELIEPTPASAALAREVIQPRLERMAATFRRLRPDLGGRALQVMMFSLIGQCLFYKASRGVVPHLTGQSFGPSDAEFLTDHITGVMLSALRAGAPVGTNGEARS